MNKRAFEPPMPPMDPAMAQGGGAPMDPSMGGAPPMDPAMMAGGGAPPMPPPPEAAPPAAPPAPEGAPMGPEAGGAPPMDPAMMQQMQMALMDPNVQAMLQQVGIIIDPQQGPIDQASGQSIPPEEMMAILQELMQQLQAGGAPMDPAMAGGAPPPAPGGAPMDPAMAGGAPPMPKAAADQGMMPPPMDPAMAQGGGAPMDPSMGGAPPMPPQPPMPENVPQAVEPQEAGLEERLSALEDLVGELAAKLEVNPDTRDSVIEEGLTDEAQDALNSEDTVEGEAGEQPTEKVAEEIKEEKAEDKPMKKKASEREQNPARKLSGLIGRLKASYK